MNAKVLSTRKAATSMRCGVLRWRTLLVMAAPYTTIRRFMTQLITQPEKIAIQSDILSCKNGNATACDDPPYTRAGNAREAPVVSPAVLDATPHSRPKGK